MPRTIVERRGMPLRVRCERHPDKGDWDAVVTTRLTPTKRLLEITCPMCGRGYFSKDGGQTFESDRPLTILSRRE